MLLFLVTLSIVITLLTVIWINGCNFLFRKALSLIFPLNFAIDFKCEKGCLRWAENKTWTKCKKVEKTKQTGVGFRLRGGQSSQWSKPKNLAPPHCLNHKKNNVGPLLPLFAETEVANKSRECKAGREVSPPWNCQRGAEPPAPPLKANCKGSNKE